MAKKPNLGKGVLARYGNWYRGDSDFFTHALILTNGECWLLGQGLDEVFVRVFKAPAGKFRQLKAALRSIPAGWPLSSYGGYNFITDTEGPNANEIAVFGKQSPQKVGYYVPPAGSQVEALVKAIANID
jgi:hypothetical protein